MMSKGKQDRIGKRDRSGKLSRMGEQGTVSTLSSMGKRTRILAVTALAVIIAMMAVFSSACMGSGAGTQNDVPSDKDFLARISVVGEIGSVSDEYSSSDDSYHHRWTMGVIDDLIKNDRNKGLVLHVDSPGGSVYESDELYLKLEEYKEKTSRPIFVYMGQMAASGGYYISAAADHIYANRNCWTGSIGVISGTYFDVSGFLKKHGITATDIVSGKNKGMGGYFEPMTDEQRAILQGLVDEAYEQFAGIVAEGRHMDIETVKELADGRIYTAKQAEANGLVDGVMTETEAKAAIKDIIKEKTGVEDIYVSNIRFIPATDFLGLGSTNPFSLFGFSSGDKKEGAGAEATSDSDIQSAATEGDISRVLDLATKSGRVPLKYMYEG